VLFEANIKTCELTLASVADCTQRLRHRTDEGMAVKEDQLSIPEVFDRIVKRVPGRIAVVDEFKSLTYEQLWTHSEVLAARLAFLNQFGAHRVIGLEADRSVEMVIGILGILKAGAGYLPIDLTAPKSRTRSLLQVVDARVLVTTRD